MTKARNLSHDKACMYSKAGGKNPSITFGGLCTVCLMIMLYNIFVEQEPKLSTFIAEAMLASRVTHTILDKNKQTFISYSTPSTVCSIAPPICHI